MYVSYLQMYTVAALRLNIIGEDFLLYTVYMYMCMTFYTYMYMYMYIHCSLMQQIHAQCRFIFIHQPVVWSPVHLYCEKVGFWPVPL